MSDDMRIGPAPEVQWAPAEPPRKKRRAGLWIGIPSGALLVAAAVCSMVLIAPGVAVAGTQVGWQTPGGAAETISQHLAAVKVTVNAGGSDVTLSANDLGLALDAESVSQRAFDERPLWNISTWGSGQVPAEITVDAQATNAALEAAVPSAYTAPVNAGIAFDQASHQYVVTPDTPGTGLDGNALAAEISQAVTAGSSNVSVTASTTSIPAAISASDAQATVDGLNVLLSRGAFTIDDQTALAVAPDQLASWLSVDTSGDAVAISVDQAAVTAFAAELPTQIDRAAVDGTVVTDGNGNVLKTITKGQDGWAIDPSTDVAGIVSQAIANGSSTFALPAQVVEHKTTELFRRIEVDKSAGLTTLYENEQVVAQYSVAIGKADTPTDTGHFAVYAQLTHQNMGCVPGYDYCTENVKWITYYNGDEALHGTYWHNNFGPGAMMSHGCVNMTEAAAQEVYYFAQVGTPVWVHD